MGGCCSKPDESVVETPSKGETQQETRQETQQETRQATQQETWPKRETQGGMPSTARRVRDAVILALTYTSIIADAADILKPMKVVSELIKKTLELTNVNFNLPDETSLFTKSHRAWRR